MLTVNLKPVILCLLLEIEYSTERFPVIKVESVITASVNNWLPFDLESNVKLHAFCYNMDYKNWEPLIDLCSEDDAGYKSWELMIRVSNFTRRVCDEFSCFAARLQMRHGEAFLVNSNPTNSCHHVKQDAKVKKKNLRNIYQDFTDMVFIYPDHLNVSNGR